MISVLGEFSSVVSVFRNKGTQSDLGAPFLPRAPFGRGYGGPFSGSAIRAAWRWKGRLDLRRCGWRLRRSGMKP